MFRLLHTSLNSHLVLKKPKLEIPGNNNGKHLVLTLYEARF